MCGCLPCVKLGFDGSAQGSWQSCECVSLECRVVLSGGRLAGKSESGSVCVSGCWGCLSGETQMDTVILESAVWVLIRSQFLLSGYILKFHGCWALPPWDQIVYVPIVQLVPTGRQLEPQARAWVSCPWCLEAMLTSRKQEESGVQESGAVCPWHSGVVFR